MEKQGVNLIPGQKWTFLEEVESIPTARKERKSPPSLQPTPDISLEPATHETLAKDSIRFGPVDYLSSE